MLSDVRFAFRNLRRNPMFTIVAICSLALGIGANTAVFTIADQVLLREIPVRNARDLIYVSTSGPQSGFVWGTDRFSYPMYKDFRDHSPLLRGVAAHFETALNLTHNNRSERVQGELVTGTWFETLGLATAIGRGIAPEDDRVPGGHPVAVLTYDYWQSRFAGSPAILNQKILLNGQPMTVIGVAARGYHGFDVGNRIDVLVPAMMKPQMTPTWNGLDDRRVIWLQMVACLNPGVTAARARASLEPYYHGLLIMEMQTMKFRSQRSRTEFATKPLLFTPASKGVSELRDEATQPLEILLGIVGLLLLIACANVANLLLARAVARRKEIAVRLAVGAGRWALVRQLLAESLLLALAGGAIGILFAWWTSAGLLGLFADWVNAANTPLTATPDARILAFTFALSLVTGLLFGLAPAWQATSPGLAATLKDQADHVSGGSHVRARKILVVSQVALSLLLLIGATLFTRSLRNLKNVDLGFQRDHLLSFSVDPSLGGYNADRIRRFAEELEDRVNGARGVRSAAVGMVSVITGDEERATIALSGRQPKEGEDMNPWMDAVGPGYFRTMGVPLLAGREFTRQDRAGSPLVAIVNETFARYYFGNENPIGRRFARGAESKREIEIVGVVRASKYSTVNEKPHNVAYLAYLQDPNPASLVLYVRAAGDPKALFSTLRREASALDPALPLTAMRTMDDQIDASLATQRMMAGLSAFFGVLATVLAAVGLYGVMAYTVSRRTRDIGIRVALGAGRTSLLRLVMQDVVVLTAAGVAIAIPAAIAATRLVRAQLYGVAPADPLSIALAALALTAVALAAGYIPADRATRVNPISALRYE
ncbi:MAG TPA: ABC transporter permease [Candidatus Acidoferrales bacterium]|nr:ABC transporter permease [Candidatus Acidoferrales bacterium]